MLKSYYNKNLIEAGCDEAGRGCLAGPVFAAAVILPKDYKNKILNDSKQLTDKIRYELREVIEKEALAFAVAQVSNTEIDEINILRASIKAMHLAIDKLAITPELILIDGNRFYPDQQIPFQTIIKGDAKYFEIAAASILAKTYRDEIMEANHQLFPQYLWGKNMGYPTIEHRAAIKKYGSTKLHRLSFQLLKEEPKLLF